MFSITLAVFSHLNAADESVSFSFKTPIIPVLTNGDAISVIDGNISLADKRKLTVVSLQVANSSVIKEISIHANGKPFGKSSSTDESVSIEGSAELKSGKNKITVSISVKSGADLTEKIWLSLKEITFNDGAKATPEKAISTTTLRLARNIHKLGENKCHTFRIPGISVTSEGTLLAVYDMRYNSRKDLQEHMDIGLSRSTDGGETWETPHPIMDMGEYGGKPQKENGCSDPNILINSKTGEIFVSAMWTWGKPNTHQWAGKGSEPGFEIGATSQFMVVRSTDNGKTWTKPENWTKQLKKKDWWLFAPAPGNGITLRDGTLVLPTQGRDKNGAPFSNISWSKDSGKTWTVSPAATDDTSECAVAELSNGSLMLNIRDNRNRKNKTATNGRAISVTNNFGKTWETHSSNHGALPEPTCMASLISHRTADGKHILLFSNPHTNSSRSRMTIQVSFDDGKTWPKKNHVLLDEKGGAYSSLVMVDERTVGILYESSQADFVFQKIPLIEILAE